MKKKAIRLILWAAAAVILCWITMFSVDFQRSMNLEKPLFALPEITADDGGSGTYNGLGYSVEVKISLQDGKPQVLSTAMSVCGKVVAASIT